MNPVKHEDKKTQKYKEAFLFTSLCFKEVPFFKKISLLVVLIVTQSLYMSYAPLPV